MNEWEKIEELKLVAAAAAKSLQSCLILCNPIDGSPPGSPVPGILQAKTMEWVAISFSNAWKWKVKVKSLSRVRPSATPWTAAFQAPPSMGVSRQEYRSEVPLPSPMITLQIAKQRQQQKLKQHEFKHQHLKIFLVQNSFFSSFLSCEKNIKYKQTYIVLPLHID